MPGSRRLGAAAAGRRRAGCRCGAAGAAAAPVHRAAAGAELDAALADQPAHAAARQVVHRDLVRRAGLGRAQENAAVVAPVGLHFHVELEVAVLRDR